MKQDGSAEDRLYYPPEQQEQTQGSAAPQYYGTFHNAPQSLPPGFPQPVHPSQAPGYGGYQTVPGYPVVEGTPIRPLGRLPCCGIGIGWFLFIIGWFLATIPWYVGAIILICSRHDSRERIGLICCTIAAILSLIAIVIGGTRGADVWS